MEAAESLESESGRESSIGVPAAMPILRLDNCYHRRDFRGNSPPSSPRAFTSRRNSLSRRHPLHHHHHQQRCHRNEPDVQIDIDPDLRAHLETCTCSCNHLGFGGSYYDRTGSVENFEEIENGRNTASRASRERIFDRSEGSVHLVMATNKYPKWKRSILGYEFGYKEALAGGCLAFLTAASLCLFFLWKCGVLFQAEEEAPVTLAPHTLDHRGRLDIVRTYLKDVPLVDGHNDFAWNVKQFVDNRLSLVNLSRDFRLVEPWNKTTWSHTDLPRLREGMVGAQFWSIYVSCEAQYMNAVEMTLEQIDIIKRLCFAYDNDLACVTTSEGILKAHSEGRIASLIGVEGGHSMGDSLAILRTLYDLGVRYLTLTHNCHTAWAGCCQVTENPEIYRSPKYADVYKGLTFFGKLVIREMNRLGMLIDLSHASINTMEDTLNITQAPIIFSHSNAYSLCNSSRNIPDHILSLIKNNGGIIMISFYSKFISCAEESTIDQLIAHINHIRDIAGEDHIGIGATYDGINSLPEGLEDVSTFPELFASLMKDHLWGEMQIKKLAGLNFLRVFKQVEKVKESLKDEMPGDQQIHYVSDMKYIPTNCSFKPFEN